MASLVERTRSTCVKYYYQNEQGKASCQWESYSTKLEALQRKLVIDDLQEKDDHEGLRAEAQAYKQRRAEEKFSAKQQDDEAMRDGGIAADTPEDRSRMTIDAFFEYWLPKVTMTRTYTPATLSSYRLNWSKHGSPFFGSRMLCEADANLMADFVEYLRQKKCDPNGHRNVTPDKTLGSATVRKAYNVVSAMLSSATVWGFMNKIELDKAPSVRSKKRKAWSSELVSAVLRDMVGIENALLHLAVHMAFICSLRPGELAGFDARSVNVKEMSCSIHQALQRANDEDIALVPDGEILRRFPKQKKDSVSTLILKRPKTEDSDRVLYLPAPLIQEIQARLRQIERDKEQYGDEYNDYGLLFSWPNGDPIEPHRLERWFKDWQMNHGIESRIDLYGLRKSGQMHKIRLTGNNYQLVAANGGHSPEVLMSNYDEALETEKRNLSRLLEANFYETDRRQDAKEDISVERLVEQARDNPDLMRQLAALVQNMQQPTPSAP